MLFSCFDDMLSHYAELCPERTAVLCGGEKLSFSELYSRFSSSREEYIASGPRCIGFLLGSGGAEYAAELMAAIASGCRVVLMDADAPEETLAEQIKVCKVDSLAGDAELAEELAPYLSPVSVPDFTGEVLFFTSGTTSRSKAVVLSEKSLCRSAWNGGELLPLSPEDTLLCLLPLNHVFGFVCSLLWPISCGAAVALGRGPRHYGDDFAFYKPTAVSLVPALLGFLLKYKLLNSELSLILIGAGDCPEELISSAKAGGRRVAFGYGLTETSSGVALSVGGDPFAFDICPDFGVTIADDGEILVYSPDTVMRGYFELPGDTAAVLRRGVLHTGDLGFIDRDGRLHVIGRKKEMLVLSDGTKIFLPEYEKALSLALGTAELCVLLDDGRLTLAIYAPELDDGELSERLRTAMQNYPRGQQIVRTVRLDTKLPRTATGKLRRFEVLDMIGGTK